MTEVEALMEIKDVLSSGLLSISLVLAGMTLVIFAKKMSK